MELIFHGGMCCGIKTIKGFTWGQPHSIYSKCPATKKKTPLDNDSCGTHVSSSTSFFTDEAPEEQMEERLARLIAFCKRVRPKGAIEAVLADTCEYPDGKYVEPEPEYCDCYCPCSPRCTVNGDNDGQVKFWAPVLESHGFTLSVPPFLNSNSGNYIYIYHLVYDASKEPKPKTTTPTVPEPFGRSV